MIEIRNLTFKKEGKIILENINLKIEEGKSYLIIGKSGSSKTSLSNLFINFKNFKENIFFKNELKLGIDILMIFQDFSLCLNPLMKVKEQVIETLIYYRKYNKKEAIEKAKKIFKNLKLDEKLLNAYPFELSGGQKQRVIIASCLITNPKLLICDEITSGLDEENENNVLEILNNFKCSKIIVSHSINVIKNFKEEIIYMKDGKIIEKGNLTKILKIENDEYIDSLKMMVNYD